MNIVRFDDFRLKYREDKNRSEQIALYESGKAEMLNISVEIKKLREKNMAEVEYSKRLLLQYIYQRYIDRVTLNYCVLKFGHSFFLYYRARRRRKNYKRTWRKIEI